MGVTYSKDRPGAGCKAAWQNVEQAPWAVVRRGLEPYAFVCAACWEFALGEMKRRAA